MMRHLTIKTQCKNILHYLSLATDEEIKQGSEWYWQANQYAHSLCGKFYIDIQIACGIIAALSPGVSWETNKKDANNFLAAKKANVSIRKFKFSTYGNNVHKAELIYNENGQNYPPRGIFDILLAVRGFKTSSFFMNILEPDYTNYVTVDRHAYKIANKISGSDFVGGGVALSKKKYEETSNAYVMAAKQIENLLPCQIQAITWLVYRRVIGLEKKPTYNEGSENFVDPF